MVSHVFNVREEDGSVPPRPRGEIAVAAQERQERQARLTEKSGPAAAAPVVSEAGGGLKLRSTHGTTPKPPVAMSKKGLPFVGSWFLMGNPPRERATPNWSGTLLLELSSLVLCYFSGRFSPKNAWFSELPRIGQVDPT